VFLINGFPISLTFILQLEFKVFCFNLDNSGLRLKLFFQALLAQSINKLLIVISYEDIHCRNASFVCVIPCLYSFRKSVTEKESTFCLRIGS
jgi:hypothetical protein